jgi:probable blue pigment (indigoidine) exporter
MSSVEASWRWSLTTAIAPVAWGSTYFVTQEFLPAGYPLYGGAIRALPAGLLLLALRRQAPSGAWWWRSLVLGVLNVAAFFALIYMSAQLLPSGLASTITASSPLMMMLVAWALLGQRPRLLMVGASVLGAAGVVLMVLTGTTHVDLIGVAASATAILLSCVGFVLGTRWGRDVDILASTSWQLIAGGVLLLPFAVAVEGAPPPLHAASLFAFGYLAVVATALAFCVWFAGLRHLSAGTVGVIGLLNPVTGVVLGVVFAAEVLSTRQIIGIAMVLGGVLAGQLRPRDPAMRRVRPVPQAPPAPRPVPVPGGSRASTHRE